MSGRRLLIVGLDGATFDVVDPLIAAGALPNLGRLIGGGVRARLRSTIPPVTAVAWPSLLTGKNPGRHGIFGFRSLGLDEYSEHRELASSRLMAGQTIFDYLGGLGERVAACLVPMTYPVWPVNGAMVAGFPTPDIRTFYTWPPELAEELGPFLEFGIEDLHRARPDTLLPMAHQFTQRLGDVLMRFLADPQYRLVMYVVSPLDYAQHRFWALREPALPVHREQAALHGDVIARVYALQDQLVGRLLEGLGPEDLVAVVSDHGGGKKPGRVWSVNQWLLAQGWLRPAGRRPARPALAALALGRRAARRLRLRSLLGHAPAAVRHLVGQARAAADAIDWDGTSAHYVPLFFPAGGINLNVRGRQPRGVVEPGAAYERLRDEMLARLREVVDPRTGQRVVVETYRREELYAGPHLEAAPDIVFVTDPGYECSTRLDVPFLDLLPPGPEDWTGDHRLDGVMVLHGRGVFRPGADLGQGHILDVAPTLLHALGLPIPGDMDGRVIDAAFEPGFAAASAVRLAEPLGDGRARAFAYSAEEEAGIRASLRGLGYLE